MRDGTELDFEGLRRETRAAVDGTHKTQTAIAEALGVHRSAVSRALRTAGPKFEKLQRRIIAHLTPYEVEAHRLFKARRVEEAA